MSFEFLAPARDRRGRALADGAPGARGGRALRGARRLERRRVLRGRGRALRAVGFADASHLRKYELQGELPALEFGRATVDGDAHVAADDARRAR